MRSEKRDGSKERLILIGLITNTQVLAQLAGKCDEQPFASPLSNEIHHLAVDYYQRHHKAPGKDIEGLVRVWAEKRPHDDATIGMMDEFLTALDGEYKRLGKEVNVAFLLDQADRRINEVKLRRILEAAEGELNSGNLDEAWDRIKLAQRTPLNEQSTIKLLQDKEEVLATFAEGPEAIVEYPGDLGDFFGDTLARDCFLAFLAPEKTGKTFWLLDLAFRSFCQRRRVAFFEAGDMSKRQIKRRFLARITRHPFRSPTGEWPCTIDYPIAIRPPAAKGGVAEVDPEKRCFDHPLDGAIAWAGCEKLCRDTIKSFKDYFHLECYPNSTLTVSEIDARLALWTAEDWVADVVIIDYADILAYPKGTGRMDTRDRTNEVWKQLRRLSQEHHCLVVTATQTKAAAYEQDRALDRRSFSEDKRKNAHCTGMIGINVRADDKEAGVMRLNWVVLREGEFSSQKVIHCASCLPLANPAVLSTY